MRRQVNLNFAQDTETIWTCTYRNDSSYDDYWVTVRVIDYGINSMAVLEIQGKGLMVFQSFPWKELPDKLISRIKIVDYTSDGETMQSEVESIQAYAFSNLPNLGVCNLGKSKNLRFIGSNAFANCVGLVEVILPGTLFGIGSRAFYNCPDLKTISFEGVTGFICFGNGAFAQGSKIAINLDTYIGVGAECFANCSSLTRFVSGELTDTTIVNQWISNITDVMLRLTNLESELVSMIDTEEGIIYSHELNGFFDFYRGEHLNVVSEMSEIISDVRDVMTSTGIIGPGAFKNCTKLVSVTLRNMRYIGENAFMDCQALTEIMITEVNWIHESAFIGCTDLSMFHYCGDHVRSYNGGVISLPESLRVSVIRVNSRVWGDKATCDNSICQIPDFSLGKCLLPIATEEFSAARVYRSVFYLKMMAFIFII